MTFLVTLLIHCNYVCMLSYKYRLQYPFTDTSFYMIVKISEIVVPAPEREVVVETAPVEFASGRC